MSTRRPRTTRCDAAELGPVDGGPRAATRRDAGAELGPVGGPRPGSKHSVTWESVF